MAAARRCRIRTADLGISGVDVDYRLWPVADLRRGPLLAAGLSKAAIDRYRELMLDPRFRAWFHDLHHARGQKRLA
ncbi:MAG: hypothetical protein ACRDP8_25050 [Actinopolymorphaceae bacterium]